MEKPAEDETISAWPYQVELSPYVRDVDSLKSYQVGFFSLDGEILGWSEEFSEPVFSFTGEMRGGGNLTDDAAWRAYVHFDQDGYSFSVTSGPTRVYYRP